MAPCLILLLAMTFGITCTMAQLNPLMFAALGEELGEKGARSLFLYQSLLQRVNALETNIRTGAIGGCESGVIGPVSAAQRQAFIRFRRPFLTPPSLSLSLSSLSTISANIPLNFQIRPTSITRTAASIQFTDAANIVNSAFVSYMACPSNTAFPINVQG